MGFLSRYLWEGLNITKHRITVNAKTVIRVVIIANYYHFFINDFIRNGLLGESKHSQTAKKLSNIIIKLDICLMSSFIVITYFLSSISKDCRDFEVHGTKYTTRGCDIEIW